jgi:NDP-sugar pyrophosphorylase family protein
MGLLKLDGTALCWIEDYLASHPDPDIKSRIDMTSLLNGLIGKGHPIDAVPVHGGWCEIDSPRDLAVAHEWLKSGRLELCREKGS